MSIPQQGRVIIAGAGPGDPDLITYKAIIALRSADVVLADRLVSPEILNRFVSPAAKIVFVGKQGNKAASTSQQSINQLLIKYATDRKLVVRLKGGDVAFYSNVLDELETLKEHHISYEIIPGITAASGASAYGGIPLTARGLSTAVRFLAYHQSGSFTDAYWQELAATDDTLVWYMSNTGLKDVVAQLLKYHIDPAKQMAIIEQATTPLQRIRIEGLASFHQSAHFEAVSPSIVVIGKVVQLYEQFKWLDNANGTGNYFTNIESKLFEYHHHAEPGLLTA